jgi:hypothetical protein
MNITVIFKILTILLLSTYLIINRFSCWLINKSDFNPCYYSGFGLPEQPIFYWLRVLFIIILIVLLVYQSIFKNIDKIFKIHFVLFAMYFLFDFFSNMQIILYSNILYIYLFTGVFILLNLIFFKFFWTASTPKIGTYN